MFPTGLVGMRRFRSAYQYLDLVVHDGLCRPPGLVETPIDGGDTEVQLA